MFIESPAVLPLSETRASFVSFRSSPRELEGLLEKLADEAKGARSSDEYSGIENRVIHLLQPVGRSIIRGKACFARAETENAKLGHFNMMVLTMWRRRLGQDGPLQVNPDAGLVEGIVAQLNALDPKEFDADRAESRAFRRRAVTRLRGLYIEAAGSSLCGLPAPILMQAAAHPGLAADWRRLLGNLKRESVENFDPSRGSFLHWVTRRFSLRVNDFIGREEHNVRRSLKTDCLRRRRAGDLPPSATKKVSAPAAAEIPEEKTDIWGYQRLSASEEMTLSDPSDRRNQACLEARIELEHLVHRLKENEQVFLEPLLTRRVDDLKGLAGHWGVTPAAVTRRLNRIRSRFKSLIEE